MTTKTDWIAVDWGTSNMRAWAIGSDGGEPLAMRQSESGMGRLAPDQFSPTLEAVVIDMAGATGGPVDVIVCGMAGARQGWMEAPYLDLPADLATLGRGAVVPREDGRLRVRILPGICDRRAGHEDVMRGEETQLLGLSRLMPDFSGLLCMPGTHSKWATLEAATVTGFSTAMTGEVFEVLRLHSVLRHSLAGDDKGPARDEGFTAGIDAGLAQPEALTALLFKTRAAALLSGRDAAWCAGYLSGLLIGAEIGARRKEIEGRTIPLLGSDTLNALYAQAIAKAGGQGKSIDATEATLAGLKAAREQIS